MAPPGPVGAGDRTAEKAIICGLMAYAFVVSAVLLGPQACALRSWLFKLRRRWHITEPPKKREEEAARERRIRAECERRRVERARLFIILSNVAILYQGPFQIMSIGANRLTLTQTILLGAANVGRTTGALFSHRLTPRWLDCFYCFCVLIGIAMKVGHEPSAMLTLSERATTLVTMLYWGVANLRPWMNALGLLSVATAETVMLSLAGSSSAAALGWMVYSIGFAGLLGLDYCLARSVRMEILAADSENELEAIRTLLDSICDVIVQLDSRLRLKQHSPKLAEVLLVQCSGRSLEGEDLRDHMAGDAERAIFTERLESSGAASAHATVFHAKMRDSSRSSIDMEFFSVCFKGRDGDQHHILGMREFTDIRPVLPPQRLPAAPPAPLPRAAHTASSLRAPSTPPLPPHLPRRALGQAEEPSGPGAPVDLEAGERALGDAALGEPCSWPVDAAHLAMQAEMTCAQLYPQRQPPPPPGLLPAQAERSAARERSERRVGLGTPAVLEQSDIRSHRSVSPRTPGAESGETVRDRACSDPGSAPALVETAEFVRELSVNYLLTTWVVRAPLGACCPKHTALLSLESIVSRMKSKACNLDFGPETDWQCQRCGIMADEYRDPRRRRKCQLCEHVSDLCLQGSGSWGSSASGKTAL